MHQNSTPSALAHGAGSVLPLLPNRVWRTYLGGQSLDRLQGLPDPTDSHFPENWIGSTTRATNVGREHMIEGISQVKTPAGVHALPEVLQTAPEYYLGRDYVAKHAATIKPLVKFLDAAVRLHFQAHPTLDFAERHLGVRAGKTEAYHILAIRPDQPAPYLYLGFQRPPTRSALREMIERQDIGAIEACFDRIPVRPGDTFIVPGGLPHAIGEGVLMVEIMEPTDFVVRFEFEKAGYTLPESARFMNRTVEFALDMLDFTPWPVSRVFAEARVAAKTLPPRANEAGLKIEDLIGLAQTDRFRVKRLTIISSVLLPRDSFSLLVVIAGEGTVGTTTQRHKAKLGDAFFCGMEGAGCVVESADGITLLACLPPV